MVDRVDKTMTVDEVVGQIKDGDTIAIGGWGPVRKPMALLRAIAKSKLKNLTFLSAGSFDIDLMLGAGKVKKMVVPFMSLEGAPGAMGNYMRMRREGILDMNEYSEHMFFSGFKAAAERLPFYPTRSGAFTDLMKVNPHIQTIQAPYTGETLVAVPPFKVDVALIHVNLATRSGYGRIQGDEVIDPLITRATIANGGKVFMQAERITTIDELKCTNPYNIEIILSYVTGVVEAPYGCHPGKIYPNYGWDEKHLAEYGKASADPVAFKAYLDKYIKVPNQEAYLKLVGKNLA